MRQLFSVVLALLGIGSSLALAQVVDWGLTHTSDEFTGELQCEQAVTVSRIQHTGIKMSVRRGGVAVFITADFKPVSPYWALHSFPCSGWCDKTSAWGWPPDDRVYIRFPDGEVVELIPEYIDVGVFDGYERAGVVDTSLARRLAAQTEDVRVRFAESTSPDSVTSDFTLPAEVFAPLRKSFIPTCEQYF